MKKFGAICERRINKIESKDVSGKNRFSVSTRFGELKSNKPSKSPHQ
jgi:hypothetical protein